MKKTLALGLAATLTFGACTGGEKPAIDSDSADAPTGECTLEQAIRPLSQAQLAGHETATVARGVEVYEPSGRDGVIGVIKIENPVITECVGPTQVSTIRSYAGFVAVGSDRADIVNTGLAQVEFWNGVTGPNSDARMGLDTLATSLDDTTAVDADSRLSFNYQGERTFLDVSTDNLPSDECAAADTDRCSAVVIEGTAIQVGRAIFYPNVTVALLMAIDAVND